MAVTRPDPGVVRRWVEKWCEEQGVAVKVTDREAVARAAALLREGRRPVTPRTSNPSASDSEAA